MRNLHPAGGHIVVSAMEASQIYLQRGEAGLIEWLKELGCEDRTFPVVLHIEYDCFNDDWVGRISRIVNETSNNGLTDIVTTHRLDAEFAVGHEF